MSCAKKPLPQKGAYQIVRDRIAEGALTKQIAKWRRSDELVAESYPPPPPHKLREKETNDGGENEAAEDDAEDEVRGGETDLDGGIDRTEDADET